MKLVILAKTASGGAVNTQDAFWRSGGISPSALGSFDAHAAETALRLRESGLACEIVAVAMHTSSEVLGGVREILALGADRASLMCDPIVDRADILGRANLLSAFLLREQADLYLVCTWNGDVDSTVMLAAAAGKMRMPFLSQARRLEMGGDGVIIERQTEDGDITLTARLPCLVEVTEAINKPRYPTMKGKLEAKRKPITLLSAADLGFEESTLAYTRLRGTAVPQPRSSPIVVEDGDDAPERVVAFLAERRLLA